MIFKEYKNFFTVKECKKLINLFKIKKHKLYIKGVDEFISSDEVITPVLGGPSWFRKLCPFTGKHKTILAAYNKDKTRIGRTAKSCPGMLNLFKNSFLLKFPCDVILETKITGAYEWIKPSKTKVLNILHQTDEQVEETGPLTSCIIIKICLPFIFQALDNKVSFMDALYWKLQPYTVVPGILDFKKDQKSVSLNIFLCFKKKNKVYEFKKGEPLCLCYTYNHSTLEINENLIEPPLRQDKGRTFTALSKK